MEQKIIFLIVNLLNIRNLIIVLKIRVFLFTVSDTDQLELRKLFSIVIQN